MFATRRPADFASRVHSAACKAAVSTEPDGFIIILIRTCSHSPAVCVGSVVYRYKSRSGPQAGLSRHWQCLPSTRFKESLQGLDEFDHRVQCCSCSSKSLNMKRFRHSSFSETQKQPASVLSKVPPGINSQSTEPSLAASGGRPPAAAPGHGRATSAPQPPRQTSNPAGGRPAAPALHDVRQSASACKFGALTSPCFLFRFSFLDGPHRHSV